jgi:hypothetical protein
MKPEITTPNIIWCINGFVKGVLLANEGNFPKMLDSAKFSVPLSSLNHCLTSL